MKFLILFIMSFHASGATCKKLNECIDVSAQLTGKKIIYDRKIVPFTYELNRPLELTKDNVDEALSEALAIFGLARIPSNLKDTVKVIEARDIKFQSDLPSFSASKSVTPPIPDTQDPVSMTYRGVKGTDMNVIEEKIRPMLSRYGRALPMRDGTLVIIDIASHVRKILPLVQKQDFPLTPEEKASLELEKKREHELELARLKGGDLHEIGPHQHKE